MSEDLRGVMPFDLGGGEVLFTGEDIARAGYQRGKRDTLGEVQAWANEYKAGINDMDVKSPLTAVEHTVIGLLEAEIDRLLNKEAPRD